MKGKLFAAGLLLFLFGVPALVVGALLFASPRVASVRSGAQPGGEFTGLLTNPDGNPVAEVPVRVRFISDGERPEDLEFTSGPDGTFAIEVPPIEGRYDLIAGGGDWQDVVYPMSFLDREGNEITVPQLEIELKPAARVEIELVDSSGAPLGDGEYRLNGKFASGLLLGFHDARLGSNGNFIGGRVSLDGLPELEGTLDIVLDSGQDVQLQLDLSAGTYRQRIEL